jgi:hypothetical protein
MQPKLLGATRSPSRSPPSPRAPTSLGSSPASRPSSARDDVAAAEQVYARIEELAINLIDARTR